MKKLNFIRNVFGCLLLVSLIFRSFFLENVNYTWNVITHVLLGIGIVGVLVFEVIIYIQKKS